MDGITAAISPYRSVRDEVREPLHGGVDDGLQPPGTAGSGAQAGQPIDTVGAAPGDSRREGPGRAALLGQK